MSDAPTKRSSLLRRAALIIVLSALALSCLMPVLASQPALADNPYIDLETDEGYLAPFSVKDIKPGDLGTKTVVLRNAGSMDGQIAIWITAIAETDWSNDGAHLDDYLKFEVRAEGLTSSLEMPCGIRQFPSSAFSDSYLWVLNVRAGAKAEIMWYWEFEENYQPQNEAQGDGLSFTINYLLGDMPPPRPGMSWMEVSVMGNPTTVLIDPSGRAADDFLAESVDRTVAIGVARGTFLGSPGGEKAYDPVDRMTVERSNERYPVVSGQAVIGTQYAVTAYSSGAVVRGEMADAPLTLRINYDPALLPSVTRLVGLYIYDGEAWSPLPAALEQIGYIGQCAALIQKGGEVGVIASYDPQESAYFLPSDLSIEPSQTIYWGPIEFAKRMGDSVVVRLSLTNIGEMPGVKNITLSINGQPLRSEQVSLAPAESRVIYFEVKGLDRGSYQVDVAGMTGSVMVGTEVNWWMVLAFSGIGLVAVSAFAHSTLRWRQMRRRMSYMQKSVMDVESKLLESEMTLTAMGERQKSIASLANPKPRVTAMMEAAPAPAPEVDVIIKDLEAPAPAFAGPSAEDRFYIRPAPIGAAPVLTTAEPVEEEAAAITGKALDMPVDVRSAEESLGREELLEERRLRVAKSFILSSIKDKGQLTLENIPRSKNAELAMRALGELMDEGRIIAIQQDHKVVYVLGPL